MDHKKPSYLSYWGKAKPRSEDDSKYHLLPYHCLDVAAVGEVYLKRHSALNDALARTLGLPPLTFRRWMVYLLAIHDLGKFANSFQGLVRDALLDLQNRERSKVYGDRHDTLGYGLWLERYEPDFERNNPFGLTDPTGQYKDAFRTWVAAVTGHHGQPPRNAYAPLKESFRQPDFEAAHAFVRDAAFLLDGNHVCELDVQAFVWAMPTVSWWLAGIAVFCDWLGSNQTFFAYSADATLGLQGYWGRALEYAKEAVTQSHAFPAAPGDAFGVQALLPPAASPTPLQRLAADRPLGDTPQLFILEDLTGSGKTEAAVMLTHRLMQRGQADGVFFGLPTMATANAMYERITGFHTRLFAQPHAASLVLAHSRRRLLDNFSDSIMPLPQAEADLPEFDEETASARCAAWLADNTKKALLASVGVGTVDQALMAILHSRHQCLRLLGLFRKVLLIDEVHANDAYMHRLLCVLLRFHAAAGGNAILLSATLPRRMRRELCAAFAQGRNQAAPDVPAENRYPLITAWSAETGIDATPMEAVPRAARDIGVHFVHTFDEAAAAVRDAAANGRCVCWIRNTVTDARAAAETLRAEFGDAVTLFHARYMMGDRLDIERGVLDRFGKASTSQARAGQILVATQVVEQSLDLDFDAMVSDIAPVDLLIQRAGRLHRHIRDAAGAPVNTGDDARPAPVLHVLAPAPDAQADEEWIKRLLPGTAAVYPDQEAVMWRTAALVAERGCLKVPEHTRELIEGVYGDQAIRLPAALEQTLTQAEGRAGADRSVAVYNGLTFEDGYSADSQRWYQETAAPTRLGEPTSQVCLLRWDGERLQPLYDGDSPFRWQMSQVSIRQYLVASEAPAGDPALAAAIQQAREEHPFLKRWLILVPMSFTASGEWEGVAVCQQGMETKLVYSIHEGLKVIRVVAS